MSGTDTSTGAMMHSDMMDEIIRLRGIIAAKNDALESYDEFYTSAAEACGLQDALPSSVTDAHILEQLEAYSALVKAHSDTIATLQTAQKELAALRSRVVELASAGHVCEVCRNPIAARESAECIDRLRQRVEEMEVERRWIPVGERLPDSWKDVLLAEECYAIAYVGCYQAPERLFRNENGFIVRPTHWMDLPALPYERKDGEE